MPLGRAELKNTVASPDELDDALEIEKATPTDVKGEKVWLFDNSENKLLINAHDDHQVKNFRVLWDKEFTRSYQEGNDKRNAENQHLLVLKRPPVTSDVSLLWQALFCQRKQAEGEFQKAKIGTSKSGPNITVLSFGKGGNGDLEIDNVTHRVVRIVYKDKKGRLTSDIVITYPNKSEAAFPQKTVETSYYYKADGSRIIPHQVVTVAQKTELNVSLSAADFDFPPVPEGTVVDDTRFDPPLKYKQGKHEYTDAELAGLAKNPEAQKETFFVKYDHAKSNLPDEKPRAIPLGAAGIVLCLVGAFAALSWRLKQKQRV